ncbi:MAG: helix-hairpin-helix domain-containing protein [Planctomycetota bacterium]|jgi:type II secretory pathway component PulK
MSFVVRKGLAIVAVLWVSVLLAVIVTAVNRDSMLDTKVCLAAKEGFRCKWAGRAGIETAAGVLNEDTGASDSLTDLWSNNPGDFNEISLDGCYFTVKVIDESSKLNVNNATLEQFMDLPEMTLEIASSIIDWRDRNDEPSEGGAEAEYYENLSFGYMIRNDRFRTIRELLMVKGMTEELLYGEDTNMNGILDFNEKDGDSSPPNDNGNDILDQGWIAYLTCYSYDRNQDGQGNSRTNINTASESELQRNLGISQGQAKWIVENRGNGFNCISDLIKENSPKKAKDSGNDSDEVQAEEMDLETFSNIADKITVSDRRRISGLVNINTASKEVIASLLGGDDEADRLAGNITSYRETLLDGMASIADVLNASSMTVKSFKKIAKYLTVRSNVYMVRSLATADRDGRDGAKVVTEAVVDRRSTPYRVLYWHQGVNN